MKPTIRRHSDGRWLVQQGERHVLAVCRDMDEAREKLHELRKSPPKNGQICGITDEQKESLAGLVERFNEERGTRYTPKTFFEDRVRPAPARSEFFRPVWINLRAPTRTGPKVVFRRRGAGYGDMICIASAVQGWRKRVPDAELHIDTVGDFGDVLHFHPDIDRIHSCAETVPQEAIVMDLKAPMGMTYGGVQPNMDRATVFARTCGIENAGIPRVYLTESELETGMEWVSKHTKGKRGYLVLVWNTRSAYKDYPHIGKLYERLKLRFPVVVLDPTGKGPQPNTQELSLRQAMAVLAWSKMVIGGDTGPLHMVGGLSQTLGWKIPYFGLYGSQNPFFRQSPYRIPGGWLQGSCPHGRQPCVEQCCKPLNQYQPCLAFSPETAEKRILETLEMLPG